MHFSPLKAGAFILSIPSLLVQVSAQNPNSQYQNAWMNPTQTGGQTFAQGTSINATFTTFFQNPYIDLFCSNIINPIVKEKINPPTAQYHLIKLDYAPQPNCFLAIQEGDGPHNATGFFGSGIFAITSQPSWSGNVVEIPDVCSQ